MEFFSSKDIEQLSHKGTELTEVERQLRFFKSGFPFIKLTAPATLHHGIKKLSEDEINEAIAMYEQHLPDHNVLKFVPASGAATRMFKTLYSFYEHLIDITESGSLDHSKKIDKSVFKFFEQIDSFAFYHDLEKSLSNDGYSLENLLHDGAYDVVLKYLLTDAGLNYSAKPKALLQFHKYDNKTLRKAVDEHFVEGAGYARNADATVRLHFTVSPEHLQSFVEHVDSVKQEYSAKYNVIYDVTYSIQKSSTDTIAVESDNTPFREKDGSLHFRPAGHGALLENLSDLNGDIIFIKNIDNVVVDRLKEDTVKYKKALAGYLFSLKEMTFEYLDAISNSDIDEDLLMQISHFAHHHLGMQIPDEYEEMELIEKVDFLFSALNRPMRVCGMVKNEGEPGGGPFWVWDEEKQLSTLQIVESSQVNMNDEEQKSIFKAATHFNPVDLVCSVRDFNGDNFDLSDFRDWDTGFISLKSKDGKELKAMELPGLWNGAMADWITIFVEVPVITFNPVKEVNDLLRDAHC